MTNAERLLYAILGPTRRDIRPLVWATEEVILLVFQEKRTMSGIWLTRDIYRPIAWRHKRSEKAIARSIQRLVNLCWDKGDQRYLAKIIDWDKPVRDVKEMLFCLAFYCHLKVPYFRIMREQPALLP